MELDGLPATADDLAALALVNYGHFTTVRLEHGGVRGLGLHLDRLSRDCAALFGVHLDVDRVRGLARHLAARVDPPAMLRITVFDPDLTVVRPAEQARLRVLVSVRPADPPASSPLRLHAVCHRRDLPEVKHVGLFGAVRQRRMAQRAGFDDALFVDPDGQVSEGPTWNIGFVVAGEVWWPAADCLPGVTARLLGGVLAGIGMPVRRVPIRLGDLPVGCGAFVTSAGVGVRPVAAIDDQSLAVEPALFERLRAGYEAIQPEPLLIP
ncbi:Branched-chain amino acid aminotransferase/4-amino-4-deoxychorismate lyase [Micromonospora viridifaciens]|uniref:Branched-chain amino acid aminotransferase/4-amino-4-deoxychorismate lyase n=1 Tax=Micromonospora viridifaciens TaxID=1881 RepID=A0A1C4Y8S2_MICVI|nr:aminotransferase class IV [Micromonospora viridifaciens]SCF17123.1 Branched-chain amino acid aminotransferase/4-amino-4-deoxychorismate lyase [Micromonospora viridifaciens]